MTTRNPNLVSAGGSEGDVLAREGKVFTPKALSALRPASLTVVTNDATNAAVTRGLTLSHTTSGTAAAGIGAGLLLRAQSAAGTLRSAGALDAIHTTATDGAEVSALILSAGIAGSLLEVARLAAVASAVNGVSITSAATGNTPIIAARGSDTNIGIALQAKGTGEATIASGNGSVALAVSNGRVEITGSPLFLESSSVLTPAPTINAPTGVVRVPSGSTSVTVTNSFVSATSHVFAQIRNATTNNVSVRAAIAGSGSVVIHLTGDPGVSNADVSFFVVNVAS